MSDPIKFALSGAAAGAANGLFGAGGGMILVPLLTRWVGMEDKAAFATSISIIAPLCVVSITIYCMYGSVDLMGVLPYLIGGLTGGFFGGKLFRKVPVKWLHKALGLLILYGGVRSLLW